MNVPHNTHAEMLILVQSHNFTVTRITPRGRGVIESFARRLIQYTMFRDNYNRFTKTAVKVYAAATADRSEYRFHINQLNDFQLHCASNNLVGELVETIHLPIPSPVVVDFQIQPQWVPHDYQIPVIEYLKNPGPPRQKFVSLQTGKGKSFCAMRAMADIGMRTLILVKPMYIEKWIDDMRRTYVLETKDIIVVRGSDQLMALLMMAQTLDLDCKVIIISTKTMQNWLKLYEKLRDATLDMGYACTPDRYCEVLGIGIKLSDETHQEFHLNFKIDLYSNVLHSFSLSATLLSDDAFLNKMYEIAYPAATRYKGPALDKYIDAYAVFYKFHFPNKIRYKDPSTKNYSHHVFEQCILRSQNTASNYFALINKILANSYIKDYKPGQKAIIFCASIDMCTAVTSYLSKLYPKLDVRRYVEEDPWENLNDADIRVTTLLSAGTAVDIDNLVVTILTTAVSSSQSNIQGLGRLRKLKDETVTPRFFYFVCEDVDKQIMYHEKKREMLRDRAKSYQSVFMSERV